MYRKTILAVIIAFIAVFYFVVDVSYLNPINFVVNVVSIFQQPYEEVPPNIDQSRIAFLLYTRKHWKRPVELKFGDTSKLEKSGFGYDKPTYIFTHGWLSSPNFPVPSSLPNLILSSRDANVILVDWSAGAMAFENQMLANAPITGTAVGDFVVSLKKSGPLEIEKIHLIGFSMGSHITGMAARRIYQITNKKVMRATGVDPPSVMNDTYRERIRKGDADYVEVIHTSMSAFGQKTPLGNADFYPNWGQNMPGCISVICNHVRALDYYFNSIDKGDVFMSARCKDFQEIKNFKCANLDEQVPMGGLDFKNASGVYYLKTKSSEPYYMENPGKSTT